MRTKGTTSVPTAVVSSNFGDGSPGAIAGSIMRVESGGGFSVGVGVGVHPDPFHQGKRVVLNIPNYPNDGYVQLRAPGSGAVLLQLQSSAGADQLGMYVATASGDARIKARGYLALHSGDAEYTAAGETMTLLANGNVGVNKQNPVGRLDVQAGLSQNETLNLLATATNNIAALTLKHSGGGVSNRLFADTTNSYTRLKSASALAFHAGNVDWGDTNEFLT